MKKIVKIGIIIQARTGSTRLPNKMILPFYNDKTILEILLERIQTEILSKTPIIVATTNKKEDDFIADICIKNNIAVYRGDELNVLNRFISVAIEYNLDGIIRICGDNPFLSKRYLNILYQEALQDMNTNDYISFCESNGTPIIKTHYGFWCEYVKNKTLIRILELTDEKIYSEHVTNYIYTHAIDFNVKFLNIPIQLENKTIRTTVDTIEDFNNMSEVYNLLIDSKTEIEPEFIVNFFNNNPIYYEKMNNQILLNQK
jgi:spore coat polysaccharide biosynthesis protein SpsF